MNTMKFHVTLSTVISEGHNYSCKTHQKISIGLFGYFLTHISNSTFNGHWSEIAGKFHVVLKQSIIYRLVVREKEVS